MVCVGCNGVKKDKGLSSCEAFQIEVAGTTRKGKQRIEEEGESVCKCFQWVHC